MSNDLLAGRYVLESEIGRGGMGIVYRARDVRLKRSVALKMLPRELGNAPDLRRRLAQEALAAASLNHSGIATVHEFEDNGGESFIVYEYIEGSTLRSHLSPPGLSMKTILDIGIQIADALTAAHRSGIIHRDLKPENIMIKSESGSNRIKITDFGLAKVFQPFSATSSTRAGSTEFTALNTSAGLMICTINYATPEQLECEPVDARTDVFALGLILYEMAAGSNPFAGKTASATIANILKLEVPPIVAWNPAAPAELDRIARKCLEKSPADRYQSAADLSVDLGKLRQAMSSGISSPAQEVAQPVPALVISRRLARGLLIFIQAGYLVMYGTMFLKFQAVANLHDRIGSPFIVPLIIISSLCGLGIRIYLISAAGFDYPDLGLKYRRLFPAALLIDEAWAASPILLLPKIGALALLAVAGLAYLPFSQHTLVYSAYSPKGGRNSAARPAD